MNREKEQTPDISDGNEFREIYKQAVENYTIEKEVIDWAKDNSDAGWGYDYDNSYTEILVPMPDQLIIQNGELTGFRVSGRETHILEINGCRKALEGYSSDSWGDERRWNLIVEEEPNPPRFISVCMKMEDADMIESQEYPLHLFLKKKVAVRAHEDTRGFLTEFGTVTFELTDRGMENPLEALEKTNEYMKTSSAVLEKRMRKVE